MAPRYIRLSLLSRIRFQLVGSIRQLAPVLLVASALAWLPADAYAERMIDGIAAQVGSQIVLVSEVESMTGPIEERMRRSGVPRSELMRVRAEALERLIEARLIEDIVNRLELAADDTEVDEAIQIIAREAGLTLGQLMTSIDGHGLTLIEYRERIRDEIERSKVLNAMVRSRVRIDPDEVKAMYDGRYSDQANGGREVHLRHMLVAFGASVLRDQGTACAIVEEAAEKIRSGEATFQAMVREVSDANRERAGDLGWIHTRDLAQWMLDIERDLEPGEISPVVETRFGCNLLQLVARREFQPVTFEQVEGQLSNDLFQRKTEEEYIRWVESLREHAYIERKGIYAEGARIGFDLPTERRSGP